MKKTLDRYYREFDYSERLKHDPVEFPRRYADPDDVEVAGFIASCFAYGKVSLFRPVIEKILSLGGRHPGDYFRTISFKKDGKYIKRINYRFNTGQDVLCFLYMLKQALEEWGSLKNLFYYYYKPDHEDIRSALNGFMTFFLNIDTSPVYGRNIRPRGLTQLLPVPEKGSACKRMNLFLRWMVRRRDVDMGIWNRISPSQLIIPLDIHISRISRCLGLTKRAAADWKTAREITEALKELDPGDPLKYDFALCHQGISGRCKGESSVTICSSCDFAPLRCF